MITPSYGLTATERVLPSFVLDWTTGLVQSTVDVTRAGVATFVGSNGYVQSATENTQRIDYSTGVAGLLVEESRTNFVTYSNNFTNAVWNTTSNLTITTDPLTSPDNNVTPTHKLEHTGASIFGRTTVGITLNSTNTFTIVAKKGNTNFFRLRLASGAASVSVYFNLNTGVTASNTAGSGAVVYSSKGIQSLGDGWYRVSATVVTSGITSIDFTMACAQADGGGSASGDFVYLWGSQGEVGAFPTSYIPTEASAVTRNADVASVTGTDFSDFYNEAEGAFAVELINYDAVTSDSTIICVDDGTTGQQNQNSMRIVTQGTSYFNTIRTANTQVSSLNPGTTAVGSLAKFVGAYKLNSFAAAINGSSVVTDSGGAVPPSQTRLRIGTRGTGAVSATMHLRKLLYWPQRLTNAEVQAFSKQG